MHRAAIAMLAVSLVGCAPTGVGSDPPDGTWVGTITTEGDVTTVVNESGSVWGGTARLVEEASIGVEVGADPYLLGDVHDLAIDDQRIYVLDDQVPVVRVYDLDGVHVRDIGREGQGPGEYDSARFVGVDADGRIYVQERTELEVYDALGAPLETVGTDAVYSPGPQAPVTAVGTAGDVHFPVASEWNPEDPSRSTVDVVTVSGGRKVAARPVPDLGYEPPRIKMFVRNNRFGIPPPFAPELVWTVAASGAIIVGRADRYEIEVHRSDGSIQRVSKTWDPVEVGSAESDWYLRQTRAMIARADELRGYDLDSGLPDHKPAFARLFTDAEDRIWVLRQVGAEKLPGCDENATRLVEFKPQDP